tara:strand:+ start:99 stop:404 length:306 start_codon:yes stop_codon:yes gene_type:complete
MTHYHPYKFATDGYSRALCNNRPISISSKDKISDKLNETECLQCLIVATKNKRNEARKVRNELTQLKRQTIETNLIIIRRKIYTWKLKLIQNVNVMIGKKI